jgi:uncharacterized protein YcfJ
VGTSLAVQAILAPTAVPQLVIYKDRPHLMQVNAKEVARELLTTKQFKCFNALMSKESAWQDKDNPTSSASGVGQLLDGTYRNLGMKRSDSTVAQTIASLAYIGRKYGSKGPCGAWEHFKRKNYY